jgi:arachidonate 15-lipoxygenase
MKRRELLKGAAAAGTAAGFGSLLAGAPSTASAALPVPRPTLPQKIDPISATLRRLELVSRQATYLWTESHLNLAGVPMGTVVPPAELPALEHQLLTLSRALEAAVNFAASFATSPLASGSLQTLDNLRTRLSSLQASFAQLLSQNAGLLTLPAAALALLGTLTGTAGDIATQLRQVHHDLMTQGLLGGRAPWRSTTRCSRPSRSRRSRRSSATTRCSPGCAWLARTRC